MPSSLVSFAPLSFSLLPLVWSFKFKEERLVAEKKRKTAPNGGHGSSNFPPSPPFLSFFFPLFSSSFLSLSLDSFCLIFCYWIIHCSFLFFFFFWMISYCCLIVQWGPWQSSTTKNVILACGSQIGHHLFGPIQKYLHSQVHFCIYMLYIESKEKKKLKKEENFRKKRRK